MAAFTSSIPVNKNISLEESLYACQQIKNPIKVGWSHFSISCEQLSKTKNKLAAIFLFEITLVELAALKLDCNVNPSFELQFHQPHNF